VLTVKQAAEKAGVSQALVYGWVGGGELAHFRLGGKGRREAIRIAEADLDAFLTGRRVGAVPQPAPPPPRLQVAFEHLCLSPPTAPDANGRPPGSCARRRG
jgi:excisionase family DNA binding protein